MHPECGRTVLGLVALLLLWSTAGLLAPAANAQAEEEWSFGLSGYAWLTGLEGEVATLPGLPAAEVDIMVGDVLENLDIGLMALGEARKGRFGVFGETFYVDVSTDGATSGPLFSTADFEQIVRGLTLGGFYRLVPHRDTGVDLVAGVRLWSVDTELRLGAGRAAGQDPRPGRELGGSHRRCQGSGGSGVEFELVRDGMGRCGNCRRVGLGLGPVRRGRLPLQAEAFGDREVPPPVGGFS